MKKVILSTFGPLHLIKSAESLSKYVNIKIIQGWIPSWWNKWLLFFLDKIVGYKLSKTIKKRTPSGLKAINIGLCIPEFYLWFSRFYLKNENANVVAAQLYGRLSKKYINDADIFHVRSGSGLGGAIEKAKKKGMKVIVDHSIAHPSFMEKQLKSEYEKYNLPFNMGIKNMFWQSVLDDCSKADLLLVNSNFVKDTFVKSGYDETKIRVVYLGVREDFSELKKSYTIAGPIKLLFTGSFGFRKGGEYLLKAMQILEKLNIDYKLTIVGGTREGKELLNLYPIKKIYFTGVIPQDEMKKYLSESDIYIFPSLCEGCAQSGMEALKAGLPVISTYESGLPIINKKNGIIIESKNENSIVEAILELRNNNALRISIGQNASQMMKEYSWDRYATDVYKIYESL